MKLKNYIQDVVTSLDHFISENIKQVKPNYLYDPIKYSLNAGGKKIRPTLMMLSAESLGSVKDDAVSCAVGIELFHIFSLVHDDIMDHDEMRRGKPTVHKKWDEPTAILAGDGLIALSNIFMMNTKHQRISDILKVYSETILAVCEGQAFDKEYEDRTDVTLDEYINMISLKTAYLLGASCQIGAIIASDDLAIQNTFYEFGFNLGIAFQIQDDILDLFANIETLGKDIGSDVFNNKNSILTIYARAKNCLPIYSSEMDKNIFIEECRQRFIENDILKESNILKDIYTNKAIESLKSIKEGEHKNILIELVEKLNTRIA